MQNRKTLRLRAFSCIGLITLACLNARADTGLEEARSSVSEWVAVEKLISEERSDWNAESVIIADMLDLLEQEKTSLVERIELAKNATSEADEKRSSLVEQREEFIEAMDFLGSQVGKLEQMIVALHAKFPPPLQEEVSISFNRIPKADVESRLSLSQRLQTIVVVLSQADKFNGGVQVVSKIQELDSGPAEVDILYFGLGGAFFQDKSGKYAGVGYPGTAGWEWKETPESASAISDLFAVYQGTTEAEFVRLPVNIR
ncbi:DUF3450 family protein [Pelagicoccus sp. SDUM812002]|uniref:DUF3450 family protein n=1 Tax=Pelagicoccus sp. SDUM812002 TaxID=3041266 RepID=UPI00280F7725|nr:DUF3450 family protein [Pelagicoccus sp. SDUM812002]MDQ8187788.1 DUF3450 family protein [Pelagicoccus sp. SDUM812002]